MDHEVADAAYRLALAFKGWKDAVDGDAPLETISRAWENVSACETRFSEAISKYGPAKDTKWTKPN